MGCPTNVLLIGPTGVGKTWLAYALAHQTCQQGYKRHLPCGCRACLDELAIGRADGRYGKLLKQLTKIDAFVIDD